MRIRTHDLFFPGSDFDRHLQVDETRLAARRLRHPIDRAGRGDLLHGAERQRVPKARPGVVQRHPQQRLSREVVKKFEPFC